MTPNPDSKRRSAHRQTDLLRTSREAMRRVEREAADRERRLFLTAKIDRTWSALTRLHAKVGAARFRDLMVDLPDALDENHSPDLRGVAGFHELLGGDGFREFLAEVTDTIESGSDPCAFWAKWLDVVIEREPAPETDASPAGWGSE